MARYSVVRLNINGKDLIGVENLRDVERNALSTQNAIYIYRGTKTQKIYIYWSDSSFYGTSQAAL